jgi:hypothetical protein
MAENQLMFEISLKHKLNILIRQGLFIWNLQKCIINLSYSYF